MVKKVERNSSVEIYRILAVFSVLVVHYNGGSWGECLKVSTSPTLLLTG